MAQCIKLCRDCADTCRRCAELNPAVKWQQQWRRPLEDPVSWADQELEWTTNN